MKINIKSTNIELTPAIREYVEEKIGSLEKFIQGVEEDHDFSEEGKPPIETWVELEKTTHHQKGKVFRAECQIKIAGKSIRSESTQEDLHLAIDEVKDELQRDIKRFRETRISRYKKAARRFKKKISISPLARFRRKKK